MQTISPIGRKEGDHVHFALQKNTNSMMMHLSSSHFFGHLCANMGTFLRNVNYPPFPHLHICRRPERDDEQGFGYIYV